MDYKGHKLYLQNKDGKFEEFTYEMAIETIGGQSQVIVELQNKIDKAIEIIDLIKPELWNISNKLTYKLIDAKNILKGDGNNEANNNN